MRNPGRQIVIGYGIVTLAILLARPAIHASGAAMMATAGAENPPGSILTGSTGWDARGGGRHS